MANTDNTKSRFRDASWFNKIDEYRVPIIVGGVGGIGSWLVLLLNRVISSETTLLIYDMDNVEEVNLAGQLYRRSDVGKEKTEAVKSIVQDFSRSSNIICYGRYDSSSPASPIMFSAFDNMSSRKMMFDNWKKQAIVY